VKDTYTHGHHSSVLKSHTWRTAENSAGYLLPHLDSSIAMLDVGCGPATITCDFATRVSSVIGIEPVPGILKKAAAAAAERGADNVSFEVGSVYELRFDDDTFDVVHAHQVLQHLTDPVLAIREMVRVTKPGGFVAIRDADYHAMTWYPQPPEMDRWMEIYQGVCRQNGAEPDAARHLLAWALEAGVERDQITASVDTWLYCTEEERQWWGDLWADRSVNSDFGQQALDYELTSVEEQATIAKAWRSWADHPAAWFTVPNGELLIRV
jgi:SAM-dependent methyltransferase